MTLVDRVPHLDPAGGRFGLGLIRAEADIHPDDWFMTCHFVDDRVMPGTLMYECCLHTLRIFLMRMGWVADQSPAVAFEPVPGVASRLKCRGQVIESTKMVTYEVTIKELGYRPEPYAIADALMLADGKPIVEITDMSVRLTGVTRDDLRRLWARQSHAPPSSRGCRGRLRPPGNPGVRGRQAVGGVRPTYRVFDEGRFIARLPGPPLLVPRPGRRRSRASPWKMAAGIEAEVEYDVPPDAWYFAADRQERMPFAVLLEAALQPCGWLAAYMGSALTSDEDLRFRNLGGSAVQLGRSPRGTGTLTTRRPDHEGRPLGRDDHPALSTSRSAPATGRSTAATPTSASSATPRWPTRSGIREASLYQPGPEEQARARTLRLPDPGPLPRRPLADGRPDRHAGPRRRPARLGFVAGSTTVDPGAWFFQAHFHQDPVWPGSLGLESFLQLLKVVAVERWAGAAAAPGLTFESPGLGQRASLDLSRPGAPERPIGSRSRRRSRRSTTDAAGSRPTVPQRRRPDDLPDERLHARARLTQPDPMTTGCDAERE